MFKSILIWITTIVLILIIFSCKSIEHRINRRTCKLKSPDRITQVAIAGVERAFKVWTGASANTQDYGYSLAYNPTSSTKQEMLFATDYYGLDVRPLIGDNHLASIVFYATDGIDNKELKLEYLLGALVHIATSNGFILHEYAYQNGSFTKIEALTSRANGISTNDIYTASSIFKTASNIIAFKIQDAPLVEGKGRAPNTLNHKVTSYLGTGYLNNPISTPGH